MTILVIADAWDAHADVVCEHLELKSVQVRRLNLDKESLLKTKFYIDVSGGEIVTHEGLTKLSDVTAVWARRLGLALTLQEEHEPIQANERIWRTEWSRHLFWIYSYLQNRYWLNELVSGSVADNKMLQMKVASRVGLNIPDTISSNDKNRLLAFSEAHSNVAIKFLSQAVVPTADGFSGLYVSKISRSELLSYAEAGDHPVVLQAYIEKLYEVRYTVVGEKHFVCRIDSQKSDRASIDWRRYDLPKTPHAPMNPPSEVMSAVQRLMSALRIEYGALDFIVDPNGRWWFLEVNTNGQWLWIEDLTGLPISVEIADRLIAGGGDCDFVR